jgi:hypothetical protein
VFTGLWPKNALRKTFTIWTFFMLWYVEIVPTVFPHPSVTACAFVVLLKFLSLSLSLVYE